MNARDIALALGGGRAQRLPDGSYLVPCPVPGHGRGRGDHNPSLRLSDGESRLLVRCFTGCDPRDVLAELRRRGLLDGGPARAPTARKPSPADPDEERDRARRLALAVRIWNEAVHIKGTPGVPYFRKPKSEGGRDIDIALAPDFGSLRWHERCPWGGGTTGCIIARYTDALTGAPRGIWRRPITGEKPKALGPVAGCVVRLWPDDAVTTNLILGEGLETVLSAALHIRHRGTLLQPAWAAGCADSVKNFPVLPGIETLTLLVDNDVNGVGQDVAAECSRHWTEAGREVVRLTPTEEGADFNDIILGKHHHGR
jgi:hypothetical protein